MANTFKLKTNAAMPASAGTPNSLHRTKFYNFGCTGSHTLQRRDSPTHRRCRLESDTSDTETNETVKLLENVPIPVGSSLEVLSGGKVVLQTTDVLKIDADTAAKIDATLSIMEIT